MTARKSSPLGHLNIIPENTSSFSKRIRLYLQEQIYKAFP